MKSIILILGDRLDKNISSLQSCDKQKDIIIMICPPFLKKDDPSGDAENFQPNFDNFYDFLERGKDG